MEHIASALSIYASLNEKVFNMGVFKDFARRRIHELIVGFFMSSLWTGSFNFNKFCSLLGKLNRKEMVFCVNRHKSAQLFPQKSPPVAINLLLTSIYLLNHF